MAVFAPKLIILIKCLINILFLCYTSDGKKQVFPVPKSTNNWSYISRQQIKQTKPLD